MAQSEVVLSVQVPEENEENHAELDMDQENEEPKVSLNVQDEADDETQRTQYGLNSPKRKKKETDLDDEDEDEGTATPATKLRQTAGINSPKQQKTMTWGNTEENGNSNALAGVITQVQQTDKDGGAQSIITQVSRDNPITPMNTVNSYHDDEKTSKTQQTSGGICSCLSTLFTCCSTPSVTEQRTIQQINSQSQDKVPKDPPAVTSVDSTSKEATTQQEDKESSHSQESSTVYDNALLPPLSPENKGKRCLVLDLDETLVHSSFKPVSNCDFIIPVEIDGVVHRVYVLKRPYVDEFLLECSKSYELVIFTASLSKYADPLLDQLDVHNVIAHRLFRESCTLHGSAYVKDMRRLGRRLKDTIFVDNSPHSYAFQPKNAVPIASWFDDPTDTQLRDFLPVLNTTLLQVKDVRHVLDAHNKRFSWLCRQANVDVSKFES